MKTVHQEKQIWRCREARIEKCTPRKVSSVVQRIQNRNLYTKKTAFGGVGKTNLRFMHQKVVEKKVTGKE